MIAPALHALTAHRQFIVYRLQASTSRPGKLDKIPIDPMSGQPCNAQAPGNWMTGDDASIKAGIWGEGHGVGFVLTPNTGLFCLDIDGCIQDDGQQSPLAHALCGRFPGAAVEVSQSGRGLHIWGRYEGAMPAHSCRNGTHGIELYTERRFIALGRVEGATGDAGTDRTTALKAVIAEYFPPKGGEGASAGEAWTNEPVPEWRGPTDDADLIRRALASKSAAATFGAAASFADLWQGNEDALGRAYPDAGGLNRAYDASVADAALAQHLAFWTGKNCERIHDLMWQSDLARDKWEREDYLRRTILAAVRQQEKVLQDKLPAQPIAGAYALDGIGMSLVQVGTQDSVALMFAREYEGKLLFNRARKAWYEWDGARWQLEGTGKALDFARSLARSVNVEGKSSMGSAGFCAGVEALAQADRAFAIKGEDFDKDNYLLNTPGGTLDLHTGAVGPHDPEDRITMCTGATPSVEGGAVFEKFLDEITQGDRELAEFLQVSLGACLSGAVESHWMLFWIGHGRNGKNTLGDLVMDAMGDYARKVPTSTLMAKAHEGHPTEIANLQGVRLAVSSEISDGEHWHEARINELTGDATLSARWMRGDHFTFQRTHKHLIFGNHRPQLRTVGDAIKSRLKIVPFKASFVGREDADLPRRLREHLGSVLAWLIKGHEKWLEAGKRLPPCQAVEAESEDYFASQSTVDMWLEERVQVLEHDERPASQCPTSTDLYNDFKGWKVARGESAPSQSRWAESMRAFEKVKSNGWRYRGLMLTPVQTGGCVPLPPAVAERPAHLN